MKWQLLKQITLPNYPGGSTVALFNKELVLVGDDAANMALLTPELRIREEVKLWDADSNQIEKKKKADIEASCVIANEQGVEELFLFGSGSKSPKRDKLVKITYEKKTYAVELLEETSLYKNIKNVNLSNTNIEAAECLGQTLILGNRGHKLEPSNQLLIAAAHKVFYEKEAFVLKQIELPQTNLFMGISGLAVFPNSNYMWATFSSEDTSNSYDDGKIGPSALACFDVNDILKTGNAGIKPSLFLYLNEILPETNGHKVESLQFLPNKQLLLVADNDNGQTTLFLVGY
jgi:hypothetical protein